MATDTTWGLVLAGGESRRMGHDKALLRRDDKSQLSHAVEVLESLLPSVFVSTRSDQRDEPERARFAQIVDRYENIGPVAGILSAMDEFPDVNWLVVACDLPNIEVDTVEHLLQRVDTTRPFTAYISSRDQLPEPLCAVYRAGSDVLIRGFVEDGINCPRKMLIRSDTCLLTQPDPASLDNVNTPEDLDGSVLEVAS